MYLQIFLITFIISLICTWAMKKIALHFKIVDLPDKKRKFHKKSIPFLGGIAIFISFFLGLFFVRDYLLAGNLEISHWLGFFVGGFILMLGGFLDDKYHISPGKQFVFSVLAAVVAIIGGIGIEKITNPFGDFLHLDIYKIPFLIWDGVAYNIVLFSDLLVFLWLMGMMYTTKLLDGVDGLVTGVVSIGALITFLFTMTTMYYQPDIGIAALILAAACLGFLVFNWHPAKIFLGEGGSLFLGYALGILAIISGGKIAIALLVMGIPIMDVIWTIIRRLFEGKNPFKVADRKHLHFRLLDIGLGQRATVFIYYAIAGIFGLSALFLQSVGKLFALILLIIIMLVIVVSFYKLDKKQAKKEHEF
ncbi:undecaprenyl/decaprenyl-phosphate alpha-N-acetylglucosaminyl 1-phosphate transferase [Candidatus Parcubacteria bacterium]|nr:undecaprenyl/decaprenyl-phosphate alpha-N-acetylglucosaminyl 1-phosphate transferase [Candidatus Parcubacteria bacterium]